jgi:hypothetical protein
LKPGKKAAHDGANLKGREVVSAKLGVQRTACKQLNTYIDRILTLVDTIYFHEVSMFHLPHYSDLIHQCLFPSRLFICSLLAKRFYSACLASFFLNCIVYCCEVAFSDFSNGMEELVKTALVEFKRELL